MRMKWIWKSQIVGRGCVHTKSYETVFHNQSSRCLPLRYLFVRFHETRRWRCHWPFFYLMVISLSVPQWWDVESGEALQTFYPTGSALKKIHVSSDFTTFVTIDSIGILYILRRVAWCRTAVVSLKPQASRYIKWLTLWVLQKCEAKWFLIVTATPFTSQQTTFLRLGLFYTSASFVTTRYCEKKKWHAFSQSCKVKLQPVIKLIFGVTFIVCWQQPLHYQHQHSFTFPLNLLCNKGIEELWTFRRKHLRAQVVQRRWDNKKIHVFFPLPMSVTCMTTKHFESSIPRGATGEGDFLLVVV